jgi:hypothetical protein
MPANVVFKFMKTYPVTTWAIVGGLGYYIKAGMTVVAYDEAFAP